MFLYICSVPEIFFYIHPWVVSPFKEHAIQEQKSVVGEKISFSPSSESQTQFVKSFRYCVAQRNRTEPLPSAAI